MIVLPIFFHYNSKQAKSKICVSKRANLQLKLALTISVNKGIRNRLISRRAEADARKAARALQQIPRSASINSDVGFPVPVIIARCRLVGCRPELHARKAPVLCSQIPAAV